MKKGYQCYNCRIPLSLHHIKEIDRQIEDLSSETYNFLIDELGLHGCVGPNRLFHRGLANICGSCFQATMVQATIVLYRPIYQLEN